MPCLYNIDVKYVKGEKFGKEFNGIVYSAKNDRGEIVSNPFKSSLFGKSFGFEKLTKTMNNNAEILKTTDMTARSKSVVSAAMRSTATREDFEKALQAKGMDVVFRENSDGRIYGVTFIDHENRVALNGSRLGKEFSANVFHAWFNEGKKPQQKPTIGTANVPAQTPPNHRQNTVAVQDTKSDTSFIEEALGIFDLKPHGEDYEETAFARRMRKKKKRKS